MLDKLRSYYCPTYLYAITCVLLGYMAFQYHCQHKTLTDTIKVYALNTGAFMASCCDWLEPTLKIGLLGGTLGYTLHKWYLLKKSKNN